MKRNLKGVLILYLALLVLCVPRSLGAGDGEAKGTEKSPALDSFGKDSVKDEHENATRDDAGEGEDGGKPKETIAHVRPLDICPQFLLLHRTVNCYAEIDFNNALGSACSFWMKP